MPRILIMGDTVPTESNYDLFAKADVEHLIGKELVELLKDADYRIINLETPLVDQYTPSLKWGINLYAPTNSVRTLKKLDINYVGLANNHIMDQGIQGLESTLKSLKENNIAFSNVGKNISLASKGKIEIIGGIKLGIYGCTEHEFSCASENNPGANPFDPLDAFDDIKRLKGSCDYLLVLYHGGKEQYRYPTPYLQRCCRKFIETGADFVVCQHSHCIGCEEKYLDGTILYGQGNFIFDYLNEEGWENGLVIDWNISGANNSVNYIPIVRNDNFIRMANKIEARNIMEEFYSRNNAIKEKKFIEEQFDILSKRWFELYLHGLNQGHMLQIEDYIKCEAHREIFIKGIQLEQKRHSYFLKKLLKYNFIIWGVGEWGDKICNKLLREKIYVRAFCDNNKKVWGSKKYGINVISPAELSKMDINEYMILVASTYEDEIESQLREMGVRNYILLSDLKGNFFDV